MLIQSAVLIILGGGSLIGAVMAGSGKGTPVSLGAEKRLGDTKPNREINKDKNDDDSQPSGMFG